MKILLLGKTGQIGWELARLLPALGDVTALGRDELDLTVPARVTDAVRASKPDVIVNAAAYTAVDRAESEQELAFAVNAYAVGALSMEAKRQGALLVHFSTDYVFDGEKAGPYVEEDRPNPLNVYGASKLAGERAIQGSGCRHLILRTSWVYSVRGRNFFMAMLDGAKAGKRLEVVNDQHGAPTSSSALAGAVAACLRIGAEGIYHASAGGQTTWHRFAEAIVQAPVTPIGSTEYGARAKRPPNSLLDNSKLHSLGVVLPDWRVQLAEVLRTLGRGSRMGTFG